MQPVKGGRFCDKCQKKVHDFTSGEPLANISEGICGRISQESLQGISFKRHLRKQKPFTWFFLLLLLWFAKAGRSQSKKDVEIKDLPDSQTPADSIGKKININGTLTDKKTKDVIPFVTVIAYDKNNNRLGACIADLDGKYRLQLNNITCKSISIKALYLGYQSMQVKDIPLNSTKKEINIKLEAAAMLGLITVGTIEYSTPLVDPFGSGNTIFNRQDFLHHPKG